MRWFKRVQHFEKNKETTYFPPLEKQMIPENVGNIIFPSIQQFQLGESSEGKTFIQFSQEFSDQINDQSYVDTVRSFIAEENRHSDMLKVFLENCGQKIKVSDPIDGRFRKLRKMMGIESMIRVLLTAEINAMTYYAALKKCTTNMQLQSICSQILVDEGHHLTFQSETLQQFKKRKSIIYNLILQVLMILLMFITTLIVWFYHRQVLKLGGYSFKKLFKNNFFWLKKCEYGRMG